MGDCYLSLSRVFLNFEKSNFLAFCFSSRTSIGVSSLLWGLGNNLGIWGLGTSSVLEMLDGLETNKFAVVEEVEGHVVVAIIRLDMVEGVAVVSGDIGC